VILGLASTFVRLLPVTTSTLYLAFSDLVLSVVAMSIVLHGLTSQPLLDYYERLKRRT